MLRVSPGFVFLVAQLEPHELEVVTSFDLHQLVVRPNLNDPAVFHDVDLVRVPAPMVPVSGGEYTTPERIDRDSFIGLGRSGSPDEDQPVRFENPGSTSQNQPVGIERSQPTNQNQPVETDRFRIGCVKMVSPAALSHAGAFGAVDPAPRGP